MFVGAQGNVSQITRGGHGQRQPPSTSKQQLRQSQTIPTSDTTLDLEEIDSDAMLDYLHNVGVASDSGGEEGGSEGDGSARRNFEMLRHFSGVDLGNEGAPEDIIGRFEDGWGSSSEDSEEKTESDDEDVSSSSSFSSDDEDDMEADEQQGLDIMEAEDAGTATGVLTLEQLEQLDPSMRFPIAVRPAPPPQQHQHPSTGAGAGGASGKKKGSKGKTDKGGKLAPGEKARLRRERIDAKRTHRAMTRGFDLAWINKELQDFVETDRDMHAFPPMPKHECRQVQRLAALYGCKAGAQGSGKRRMVMVVSTARTALPTGQTLLEVGRLLVAHTHGGSVQVASPAAGFFPGKPPKMTEKHSKGRWSDVNKKKGSKHSNGGGQQRRGSKSGAVVGDFGVYGRMGGQFVPTGKPGRKYSQPVSFISKGTINPEDVSEVEVYDVTVEERDYSADVELEGGKSGLGSGPHVGLPVFEDRGGDDSFELDMPRAGLGAGILAGLPVFEDRKGGPTGSESDGEMENDHVASGSALGMHISRGTLAAEGITNSGRLLGLGMALGIGAEVFGAPGVPVADSGDGKEEADLSPLQPQLSKSAQRKLSKRRSVRPTESADTGLRKPTPVSGEYADFEQHTTGIGSKLLAKWGFAGVGAGLGRDGTGISEPLQVKMRAKKLGLGADR